MIAQKDSIGRGARRRRSLSAARMSVALVASLTPMPVLANNYGESLGWQFKTSADRANQAAVLDLIEKRRGGY
ncbi:MAG: hypothetical protein JWR80_408 [Bradyrhizobium sp.]|nr:hypothetical protein [Bradyrhizobium sp.]